MASLQRPLPLLGLRLARQADRLVRWSVVLVGVWVGLGLLLAVVLAVVIGTAGFQAWKDWFERPLGLASLFGYVGPLLVLLTLGWGLGTLARAFLMAAPAPPSARWLAATAVAGRLLPAIVPGFIFGLALSGLSVHEAIFTVAGSPLALAAVAVGYASIAADWYLIGGLRRVFQPVAAARPDAPGTEVDQETGRPFGEGPFLPQVARWGREWWYAPILFAFVLGSQAVRSGTDELLALGTLLLLLCLAIIQFAVASSALASLAGPFDRRPGAG
jgi:hypothetical protein